MPHFLSAPRVTRALSLYRHMARQRGITLLAALTLCLGAGCVDTADCDQATPCPSPNVEVCYQFRCVPRCTKEEPVCDDSSLRCRACEENCPGDEGYACVLDTTR